jgi:hypothetical protein
MTKKLLLVLAIFVIMLLNLAVTSSFAWDCNKNLAGYSWDCTLERVDDQFTLDFNLTFFNNSEAAPSVSSSLGSGVFACQMQRKFFSRRLVSGRSFLANLFDSFAPVALTGTSYRRWILNGTGVFANASAFIYSCDNPEPFNHSFKVTQSSQVAP